MIVRIRVSRSDHDDLVFGFFLFAGMDYSVSVQVMERGSG